jgi:uncharacterized protein YjiS (DUF1127 family)
MATSVHHRSLGNRFADAITVQDAAINSALRESISGASSFFSTIADAFTAYRERRAAVTELNNLNDRELADLGIARADIRSVVSGKFNPRF